MRRAFTLVELIVVVIIIGILLSVGIPQYRKALERSRGAEGYAGLAHIQQGEKVYFATTEHYFTTTNRIATIPGGWMSGENASMLDISLPQTGWYFNVSSASISTIFTGEARRVAGPCRLSILTIDQNGTQLPDTDANSWQRCVNEL